MKAKENKPLHALELNKVTITALTNNEKNKIVGGATDGCDARTGIPCLAANDMF